MPDEVAAVNEEFLNELLKDFFLRRHSPLPDSLQCLTTAQREDGVQK
jgi:hypothetical protein